MMAEAMKPGASGVPTVVLGARPCDAAGVAALDKVMGWDYRDEAWFARREATTIVSLACESSGPDCFCVEVGLGPACSKGTDVLLTPAADGFHAEACTEKGLALFGRAGELFRSVGTGAPPVEDAGTEACGCALPPVGTAGTEASSCARSGGLDIGWDDPVWDRVALRCHGCGACATVCPTCHCFDIVDEPDGLLTGTRRRNWDTCQAGGFTRHASGHNPRADQRARFRQRVMHKFSIYPQRFGQFLCTGCGRCAAACPAGQNLPEILGELTRRTRAERGNAR